MIFQTPVRERLQMFLQSSDLYDPEEILDLIEGSELWWEKVGHFYLMKLSCILYSSPSSNSWPVIYCIDILVAITSLACHELIVAFTQQAILYRKLGQETLVLQILAL